jgi:hypothetical protein
MKALTWKAVFASLNPSPVFEVVATLAEELTKGDDSCSREIDDANASAVPKHAEKYAALPLSEI